MTLTYMSGFGNDFETESLPGALPVGRNSPQKCPYGLYAEQISGSPFTAPRDSNQRSWLYRIRPSVLHSGRFVKADQGLWRTAPCAEYEMPPGQLRWSPTPIPDEPLTLVQGVRTMTTAGDAGAQAGLGAHIYLVTASMQDEYLCNADGEMLFALQQGALSAKDREIVSIAAAQFNGCGYCLSAHTLMGKGAGLPADAIAAARQGQGSAVAALTHQVLRARGQISDGELAAARDAGLSDAQITEVVAAVALNVLTNYFNNLAGTEIDFPRVAL